MAECCWLQQLLQELHIPFSIVTVVDCGNVITIYMTPNPIHHKRTKHIETDIHFVRDKVAMGNVHVLHVRFCAAFGLRPHINAPDTPLPNDPQWVVADSCFKSWLFGSVGDSVPDLALGDSTISEYCQHTKLKAAELRAVDHPIEGRSVVFSMLRELNPRFTSTIDDITNSIVLPSFSRAHDMVVLKETRLSHDEKSIANTALLASAGSSCTSLGLYQHLSGNKKKGGGSQRGNSRGNGGGGHGQQSASSGASTNSAPQP
ncbi:uncharacterized protein LOC120645573 [Panicum virgatum]|uniref:uncharacterized protein LOC120645573 n=1 Tax=Panicum virgatum TaxID=38727 RepID=UPI0019D5B0D8|nr:uncharacterized protein LOC120645573 [Panicum virgatum]